MGIIICVLEVIGDRGGFAYLSLCPGATPQLSSLFLLQEGWPLPGPESGLLFNTRKWIVRGDTRADKAKDLIGKGCLGGEQRGKGNQDCSAMWLTVSVFVVMGLVSGLSLANYSDSRSFLVTHASLSQDGFQREGFWEVGWTYGLASPFSIWSLRNSSSW